MMMTRKIAAIVSTFVLATVSGVAADECQSIYDIVCSEANLENFCGLTAATETDNMLSVENDLTVFVPTNAAVKAFDFLTSLHDEKLREVVLFHVYDRALHTEDMKCEAGKNRIRMQSGKESRTICESFVPTFQKGGGNSDERKPVIVSTNIDACNGVIHLVDTVMLPGGFDENGEIIENGDGSGSGSGSGNGSGSGSGSGSGNGGGKGNAANSSVGTRLEQSSWYAFAAVSLLMYFY